MEEVVLVDKDINSLLISTSNPLITKTWEEKDIVNEVQPATLDIPLTQICFVVKHKMLPLNIPIAELVARNCITNLDLSKPSVLYKGQTYLVFCGIVTLPKDVSVSLSPKSSIGRVDCLVRAIFDKCGFYDLIPKGQTGELWLEISPCSFNILVVAGLCMTQMMFLKTQPIQEQRPVLSLLPFFFSRDGELLDPKIFDTSTTILTLQIDDDEKRLIGYEALATNEVLDLQTHNNDPSLFFTPIYGRGGLILEKGKFYILATKERVLIPNNLSAEMVPFAHNIGELRIHYAGFLDPLFNGVLVLEVRPYETVCVLDEQPIALVKVFQNAHNPSNPYGDKCNNSHYQNQSGPCLAKFFHQKSTSSAKKQKL